MTALRIALVVQGWPLSSIGGVGRVVEGLARSLLARGHAVTVLAPRRLPGVTEAVVGATRPPLDGPSGSPNPPLRVVRVGGRPSLRWRDTWEVPGQAARLRAWLTRARPDVVHIHHLSGWTTALPALAREAGARVVVTLHDYHLLCPRGQLVDARGALCAGPSGRCRGCARGDLHQVDSSDGGRAAAGRAALAKAHRVLSPSADQRARLRSLGVLDVHPVALPIEPIPPAPEAPPGPLRLLFLGSLLPTKGPDRLLRAFQRLPVGAARLTLVGPGESPFATALRAAALATPGATVLPRVPGGAVARLLHAHDVLVVPSTWPENSPLVVREAAAAGLRVVGPTVGGTRELDPTARLLPPDLGDDAFADLLAEEIRRGRGRRAPLGWPTPADHADWLVAHAYCNPTR